MSDEQGSAPFRVNVPTDRAPAATLSALLRVEASIDALAQTLFGLFLPDEEASKRLARMYAELKQERLLELAFELQDTPPAESEGTEEESRE